MQGEYHHSKTLNVIILPFGPQKQSTARSMPMKIKSLLILSVLALVPGLTLQAATRTWSGPAAGTWSTAGNWVGGIAPVSGDSIVIANGNSSVNNLTAGTAIAGISMTSGNVTLSGTNIQLTGDVLRNSVNISSFSFSGIELIGATRTFTVDSANLRVYSLVSGTSAIVKMGAGQLIFDGQNNTFSGGITVSAGSVASRGVGTTHLGAGKLTINTSGSASLQYTDMTISNLGGNGGAIYNSTAGSRTLTIDSGTATVSGSYAGVIQDGGAGSLILTKAGAGTQTLTGTNTYTGATTVSGGTLLISGGGALGNTAVTVTSAGTFGGNGGTVAGAVQINSGGKMAFTLTSTAQTNLTLASTLNLAGSNDLKMTLNVAPAPSDAFTIISNTGARTGTFATINGAAFGVGNTFILNFGGNDYNFVLNYNANSIVAQVVPEPSICLLAGLALGTTLIFRRRNRR